MCVPQQREDATIKVLRAKRRIVLIAPIAGECRLFDASYDKGISFRLKWFRNDGYPSHKIVGKYAPFFVHGFRCASRPYGIFHPVAGLLFSKNFFLGEVFLSTQN